MSLHDSGMDDPFEHELFSEDNYENEGRGLFVRDLGDRIDLIEQKSMQFINSYRTAKSKKEENARVKHSEVYFLSFTHSLVFSFITSIYTFIEKREEIIIY